MVEWPQDEFLSEMVELPWRDARCVICGLTKPLTEEHVIPQSIGGIFWYRFLCEQCNSMMGKLYEGDLPNSPEIRLAAEWIQQTAPETYRHLAKDRDFLLDGKGGPAPATLKHGVIVPTRNTERREGEEVTTFDSKSAAKAELREILAEEGWTREEIETAIGRIANAPLDTRVEVSPGIEFANWRVTECTPTLTGRMADERLALKIAYEFLCICIREQVFHPGLEDVRTCLERYEPLPASIVIEGLSARNYSPFHSILFDTTGSRSQVVVRLFGKLVWRVRFLNVGTGELPSIGYRLDLSSGEHRLMVFDRAGVS